LTLAAVRRLIPQGDCEDAFRFYERCLGAEAGAIFRYGASPSVADAERIFHELAKDGRVVMPLEKTFWASRFGMVVDRFGIPWLINCEASVSPIAARRGRHRCGGFGHAQRATTGMLLNERDIARVAAQAVLCTVSHYRETSSDGLPKRVNVVTMKPSGQPKRLAVSVPVLLATIATGPTGSVVYAQKLADSIVGESQGYPVTLSSRDALWMLPLVTAARVPLGFETAPLPPRQGKERKIAATGRKLGDVLDEFVQMDPGL
jgi:hypothetical protein